MASEGSRRESRIALVGVPKRKSPDTKAGGPRILGYQLLESRASFWTLAKVISLYGRADCKIG